MGAAPLLEPDDELETAPRVTASLHAGSNNVSAAIAASVMRPHLVAIFSGEDIPLTFCSFGMTARKFFWRTRLIAQVLMRALRWQRQCR